MYWRRASVSGERRGERLDSVSGAVEWPWLERAGACGAGAIMRRG